MTFRHIFKECTKDQENSKPLDVLLSKTLSQLRSYVYLKPFSDNENNSDAPSVVVIENGGNNKVQLQPHPVRHQLYDPDTFQLLKEEKTIRIAVSTTLTPDKPKFYNERAIEDERTQAAFKHLSNAENNNYKKNPYNHSTTFIQHFLYTGKGRKISIAADQDLYDWIFTKIYHDDLTEEILKKIIAQMFLAANYLHSNEIVHRDFKFENYLMFGHYVELADLDSVIIANNPAPYLPDYTSDYLAPECRNKKNKKLRAEEARISRRLYRNLLKKPIDCYAIGQCLQLITKDLTAKLISQQHKELLQALSDGLIHPDPTLRLTIKQAMSHPYFGTDEKTCEAYFTSVKKEFEQPDHFYGGYYYNRRKHGYPTFEDAFFLLPDPIKDLYIQAASLQTQIKLITEGYELEEMHFDAINKQINRVMHSLQTLPEFDRSHSELKSILKNLKKYTEQTRHLLAFEEQRFKLKLDESETSPSNESVKRRRVQQ